MQLHEKGKHLEEKYLKAMAEDKIVSDDYFAKRSARIASLCVSGNTTGFAAWRGNS